MNIKIYNYLIFCLYRNFMKKEKTDSKFFITSKLDVKWDVVLLVGNWWYRNMWDELILLWNVKLLLNQWKKVIIACYDPKWLCKFFSQFIDVKKVIFISELPKGFRSLFKYVFKYWMRWFFRFWNVDTIVLWGWEILTEENPWAYWYWKMSIWPFLFKKRFQKLFKKKKSDLYIMWGVQVPKNFKNKRKLLALLNNTTACYLRDFNAVSEISPYVWKCDFFMDTSYFSYDWNSVSKKKVYKEYIVINLNKNGEQFFSELVRDIKHYCDENYCVYYVPIAKWNNTYYDDLQYYERLKEALGNDVDLVLLDWEVDFDSFVKILKWAKKVYSSRLHLYLIASFLGCDTKVYPYQRKILKMQKVIDKLL